MFINLSNHSSLNWSIEQILEASKYGEIVDISFPEVDPSGDTDYYNKLVDDCVAHIMSLDKSPVVMVQGEFILTFRIVTKLKTMGIKCVAASTKREAMESIDDEGRRIKTSIFKFEGFTEY